MIQENPVSPVPFEWSVANYSDDSVYATASRNGIPIGIIEGESRRDLPSDHYRWTYRIFMPGAQVPEPMAAPRSALPQLQERFKIAFDQSCERLQIRPVYPMLIPQWRDLGADGHGLYSGEHLVHRIYKVDGVWWHESYLNFGSDVATSTRESPTRHTFVDTGHRDEYENTLEGAKNRGSLRVTAWLFRSNFMARWDPNSLPVGQAG